MPRLIRTAVLFGLVILVGELTFGNPGFPIQLWQFETIPAWMWSGPVHVAGFIWMVVVVRMFGRKAIAWPVLCSFLPFVAGETLNVAWFHFFSYPDGPVGCTGSFLAVLFLYLVVCLVFCFLIRRDMLLDLA